MKFRIYLFIILLLAAAEPVNSWYSQLFPYNAGTYDEATVNFNGRDWRLLDYSYVGYNLGATPLQTGIPCNVQTITGTGDITVELQNKINTVGAAGGGIVKIPAGTYIITQTAAGKPIGINYDNVSVEGAGSSRTFINVPPTHAYSDDSNAFEGTFTFEEGNFAWNKGWVEGGTDISHVSNTITEGSVYISGLTNLAAVNVGAWIVIQQYFWAAFCTTNSNGAWTSGDPGNREYSFTYLRRVLSKDASGITVDAPIPYTLNPANNTIYIKTSGPANGMLQNVGISGMTIQFDDNNNGFGTRAGFPSGCAVYFEGVVNGWVKDVTVINFPRYGIHPEYSARITIEDCYIKKTQDYGGGGAGYGFYVNCAQNILIKRCHGEQTRHNFILSRALSHYVVMTQCSSFDAAQCEDTHFGFSHALLRDKFIMGNGNAYNGYNRWTTSGNAYESFGTGAVWNLYGDGYGGQWHAAELNINPSADGYAMEVGVAGGYIVHDGAGYAPSGTYVVGTTMANNAGLQVGPASWRQNVLYEGVGFQAGLQPESLYEEQLKNRVGTVADWANVCGDAATMTPVPTNTPILTPGILVFDSEIPAFGLGLGSGAATPATTITPGNNPNDAGQNRTINGAESFRLTSASADWGIVANFGGPVMSTSSLLRFEGWVYITDANYNFRLQLQNPAGTDIGSSVIVNNTLADGGIFNVNQWNHFQIPIASFGYSGSFTGIGMRTGTLTANKTAWFDDFYFIPNSLPTATFTRTISFTATRTNTSGGTNTFTRTPSRTSTGTITRTSTPTGTPVITATFTRTASPSATRTNTVIFTSTRTPTSTPATGRGKRLLAYYPYWMSSYRADKIPYTKLTHICHAFVQPQANGSLVAPVGPPAYIEPALITNAHANGVKVLVSVGGADSVADANFRTISASPALRTAFADALEAFCRTNGYDGVDLDWEFPQSAADRTNQNLMVQAIRTKFNSSPAPAPSWLITSAVSSGNWYGQWNDYATLNSYMDFYNVMTYDYHGSWSAHSGHNSPIYQGPDPDAWDCIDYNMNYMLVTRGVPADKMNLGMPFYGRSFNNSETLYDACGGSCADTYYNYADMVALIGNGWTYNWDAASLVPYLTNDSGTGVLSYDNPQSIGLKVDYGLTTRALGGVFMWDLSADYISGTGQPLMDAMYNAYSSFCGATTPTNTPVNTATYTRTRTRTATASTTMTATATRTRTQTPANTATQTNSASPSATATVTSSIVPSSTASPSITRTVSITVSPTLTLTSNLSPTNTVTLTPTRTNTPAYSPTETNTGTPPTDTVTPTATATFTRTLTATATFTGTSSFTPTFTASAAPSATFTGTATASPVSSSTPSPIETLTHTVSNTPSPSFTSTPSRTATLTATQSASPTLTLTSNLSPTFTPTATPTIAIGDKFEIVDLLTYPCPVNGNSDMYFGFTLTRRCDHAKVRIYTVSFRLISEIELEEAAGQTGAVSARVEAWRLGSPASGTYYYVIIGENAAEGTARSKVDKFIVLK